MTTTATRQTAARTARTLANPTATTAVLLLTGALSLPALLGPNLVANELGMVMSMGMTHYMELLAVHQPRNLIIFMAIPVVLAETLAITELAILFADVVGSSRLFEALGDERASDLVADCVDLMRRATEEHRGRVVKTMGDEVMSTFPSASDALNAACQMQKQITAHSQLKTEGHSVAIRVGCHFGPVVLESRDVFGSTVHTANRMTSQAKAGQIVTTAATVAQLSPDWRAVVRQIDVATIKGQGSEVALYEVMWQPDDATSMLPQIPIEGRKVARLRLQFQDRELVVDEGRPNVVDRIKNGDIRIVFNTPLGGESFYDDSAIRKSATQHNVLVVTTLTATAATVQAIRALRERGADYLSLQEIHAQARA